MTWQEFMGRYLHKDKFVICVAGTHGKSTTTALAGLLLEAAGLDPTVEIGANVPSWNSNVCVGKSKYFISEADEYYGNFLNYHPDVVILNNLEMDHPEYFKTLDNLIDAYSKFISQIKHGGTLIYNSNSQGIRSLLSQLPDLPITKIAYTIDEVSHDVLDLTHTTFTYKGNNYDLSLPGHHNIENALGIIELGKLLDIPSQISFSTLKSFTGLSRRLELIGQKHGIKVFDDYANHPTAFMATLQAAKQVTGNAEIWAIIEPHTFSRLRAVLNQLPESVQNADHVIVSQIYPSREADPGDFTGQDIVAAMHHPDARYIPEFSDIVNYLKPQLITPNPSPTAIIVMGSGNSYRLSRQILESI